MQYNIFDIDFCQNTHPYFNKSILQATKYIIDI